MSCIDLQNKYNEMQKNYTLLERQRSAQDRITELLNRSATALTCGPECQKEKISSELMQKYLNAQTNLQTAPINLETTRKNYYVFSQGRPFYDNMLETELKQKAEKIAELITESFNDEVESSKTMNQYFNTDLINSRYIKEYLKEYIQKNQVLKKKLRNRHGDILTNDRKTYYETDALSSLQLWYKLWWYIYYLLVIVFIIAIFISPSNITFIKKVIIGILIIFYPYYINYIVTWFQDTYKDISTMIPKNVYNDL